MLLKDCKEDFDIFEDLSDIVNSEDSYECKQNIIYVIEDIKDLDSSDIYEAIKNVVEHYYGGVAFSE